MSVLDVSPVIPVVVLEEAESAVQLARALVDGGVPIIEITLRTPAALEAVRAVAAEVPDILLGVGTVVSPADVQRAVRAGAGFLVAPGTTPTLLKATGDIGIPLLPGVSTVSEVLTALEHGISELKFFPAQQCGGAPFLAALRSPLPQVRFCPTGGISAANALDYLALSNVGCVGGSWLTPTDAVRRRDFARIQALAAEAAALRRRAR
ncbi:bifunctional 4-hydroxy-2-oxoglutarate aldolase/2-dehydro-3-deoxy-phosphogluconate aldolase [Kineococcus gypseus]|uniref:bifunctional 4-hydroxy-2-oxoglutarate aldolase/2-dehydro-3-deoxy-phosphogluconate aldolase n=1 Tax=Kineococcus gypseus TaxID=1637102 RepID=UPI003D7E0245